MSRTCSLSIAALLAALAFVIALPGPMWPLVSAHVESIEPATMLPVYGKAATDVDGSLFITGADRDTALQVKSRLSIDASVFSVLRYSARDFPATLELALSWRRADDPLETHIATLPAPGSDARAYDLSSLDGWTGTIIELGVAQFPVPHHVPSGRGFRPFHLDALRLESPALGNGIALFRDALIEPRPWTHHSINSLGRELGAVNGNPQMVALLAGLGTFIVVWLALSWRRVRSCSRRLTPIVAVVALVWLLLDIGWQARLSAQNELTMAAAAAGIRGDEDLVEAANTLRTWLSEHRPDAKLLVLANAAYSSHRFVYLLLPFDVAVVNGAVRAGKQRPPAGTLLVVYAPLLATRDGHELHWPGIAMTNLIDLAQLGPLRVYEYGGSKP